MRIKPEPSADSAAGNVVRIALKMPEAARIMRRFAGDAPIEELYAFVECYEFVRDGGGGVVEAETVVEQPVGYEHSFKFRLVSTLPRVVYSVEDGGTIAEKVGRSGNLIVEPIAVDEDDD